MKRQDIVNRIVRGQEAGYAGYGPHSFDHWAELLVDFDQWCRDHKLNKWDVDLQECNGRPRSGGRCGVFWQLPPLDPEKPITRGTLHHGDHSHTFHINLPELSNK